MGIRTRVFAQDPQVLGTESGIAALFDVLLLAVLGPGPLVLQLSLSFPLSVPFVFPPRLLVLVFVFCLRLLALGVLLNING